VYLLADKPCGAYVKIIEATEGVARQLVGSILAALGDFDVASEW
jgi:hypothetical protein